MHIAVRIEVTQVALLLQLKFIFTCGNSGNLLSAEEASPWIPILQRHPPSLQTRLALPETPGIALS